MARIGDTCDDEGAVQYSGGEVLVCRDRKWQRIGGKPASGTGTMPTEVPTPPPPPGAMTQSGETALTAESGEPPAEGSEDAGR
jgi:hypothetical protein